MASGSKCPAPAVATHFGPPATLRAWTERLLSTRQQVTGSGLMGEADVVGDANAAPPLPRQQSCPQPESRTRQAVRLLPGIQQTNGFTIRLAHLAAGEPPDPVPLGRELQASGPSTNSGSSASSPRPTLPPKLACRMRSISHASPDALSASRIVAPIATTGPDPGETPGIGPSRPITRKTKPQDAAQRP